MNRTILVTGASSGIGAATARYLAPGNTVFVHYNSSRRRAEEVATDVRAHGGDPIILKADLTNSQACEDLIDGVASVSDHLDVLVNNSGGLVARQAVAELTWELMEETFALNLFGPMRLTALCVPLLRLGIDPVVINVTSVAARNGAPTATLYGAAKGALDTFTRGAAMELAPDIRVNAVAPGVIETPFHERASTPERLQQFRERTPVGRNGTADDVASAIACLVENSFINGETIDVNGGMNMR